MALALSDQNALCHEIWLRMSQTLNLQNPCILGHKYHIYQIESNELNELIAICFLKLMF